MTTWEAPGDDFDAWQRDDWERDRMAAEDEIANRAEETSDQPPGEYRRPARKARATPPPAPKPPAHTETRHGHMWNVNAWGYATRNCAFGLICECAAQPDAAPIQTRKPTPIPRPQRSHAETIEHRTRRNATI